MSVCQRTQEIERMTLSPYATLSENTRGRARQSAPCDMRTEFQRDRDKIIHCKSFRRLKHKTQVFITPEGDHYRTRLTHTLEVAQIARTIARGIRANEDLTEAIAIGHDIGHTPFGHAGERTLDAVHKYGFAHNEHSIRVAEVLENDGKGLNLTFEVLDGMRCHRTGMQPVTIEGQIVQLSDKIAYINHDIDDALRAGILREEELPKECTKLLGTTHAARIDTLVRDVILHSMDKPNICTSDEIGQTIKTVRAFMFESLYISSKAKAEEQKAQSMIKLLYEYLTKHPGKLPKQEQERLATLETEVVVCDYIAGMTDSYAIETFTNLFVPKSWKIK